MDHCKICREPFEATNNISNYNSQLSGFVLAQDSKYHKQCFRCFHCLQPFPDGSYYRSEEDGMLYCEQDYFLLYGDRCAKCGDIIMDSAVNAMELKWHPHHFLCEACNCPLAGVPYFKHGNQQQQRPYCKQCYNQLKLNNFIALVICERCKKPIESSEEVYQMDGMKYHAHHFSCSTCKKHLDHSFKMHQGKMYCGRDYDLITAPLCYTCNMPIHGRSTSALGKVFHIEHFVCWKCEVPFQDATFWEYQGKPYCRAHFNELSGFKCSGCFEYNHSNRIVSAQSRKWCREHFTCIGCDKNLADPSKRYMEWDGKIMCVRCYDKLPANLTKRLYKYDQIEQKVRQKYEKEMRDKALKEEISQMPPSTQKLLKETQTRQ